MHRPNIAARAAAWSAAHARLAVLGWVGLVILAFVLAGTLGQNTLDPSQVGNGDSQRADRAIDHAGFPDRVDEQVLVQARGGTTAADAAFAAGVRDVVARLEAKGLLHRAQDPADARAKFVLVTPAGASLAARAIQVVEDADAAFFSEVDGRALGATLSTLAGWDRA